MIVSRNILCGGSQVGGKPFFGISKEEKIYDGSASSLLWMRIALLALNKYWECHEEILNSFFSRGVWKSYLVGLELLKWMPR